MPRRPAMTRILTASLLAVMAPASWCQHSQNATVTFLVVDESGKVLPNWKVSTFSSSGEGDLSQEFEGLASTQIPFGFYDYRLTGKPPRPNYVPELIGRIQVQSPEKFVVRTATPEVIGGFTADFARPRSFVIRGRIEPMPLLTPDPDPVRVNIHPMNPWSDVDVKVDPNGEFRIYEALTGLCILTVRRGAEVLYVRPAIFERGFRSGTLVLRIGDKPLDLLRVE